MIFQNEIEPGQYRNPILDADWPDPDVIRVGSAYFMVTSSFNRAPGLPVLQSSDLVNWRVIARALPQVPPAEHFNLPRHGCGVWAPSIRHHDDTFVIVYPDPDHGILVTTATDPAGPWSTPHTLLAGRGLIDPCPLWDADGRAYLVHGWAKSRSGFANRLTVVEVAPDLSAPIGEPRTVIDGDALPGYGTLEGPKFYLRDGWYWIFAPAGGVKEGWQSVFRSRSVWGPYEDRIVLAQGTSRTNGPHQGAWVTTPEGVDWFLHFQDREAYGRVVHLQPMAWVDGWPQIGVRRSGAGEPGAANEPGEPVLTHALPAGVPEQQGFGPDGSDDFSTSTLGLQWYWQANPDPAWLDLSGPGLTLPAVPNDRGNLRDCGQVLGQQLPGWPSVVRAIFTLDGGAPGVRAGLVVLGESYAWLGFAVSATGTDIVCGRFDGSAPETEIYRAPAPTDTAQVAAVEVEVRNDGAGTVTFAWRSAGSAGASAKSAAQWIEVPGTFAAKPGRWIGAEIGLFAAAPVGAGLGAGSGAALRVEEFTIMPLTEGTPTYQ